MENHIIASFSLKASGRGKEATGGKLYIVDCVRLYLLRHVPYSPETSSYSIAPLKEVREYDTVPGLPDLKSHGYSYILNPLRKGFVYVYIEKKSGQGIYREYEVSEEGSLTNLVWSDANDDRVSWDNPNRELSRPYLPLKRELDKKLWITFSPVRWSQKYAEDLLNDADKRNRRMQAIDCAKCFDGAFCQDSMSVEDENESWLYSRYMGEDTESNYDYCQAAFSSRHNDRKRRAYANVAQDGDSGDFYVTVLDPLGVADFLCRDYTSKCKELQAFIEKMRTGDFEDPYKSSELSALIDLGIVTNLMWDTPTSLFYKYRSHLNENLLKAVLKVEERKAIRKKINKIRYALNDTMRDAAYKLAVEDYLNNDTYGQLKGKEMLFKHFEGVLVEPEKIDGYMDGPINAAGIRSSGEPDVDDFIDKFVLGDENTAKLLRTEWDLDKISASTALVATAGVTLDSAVNGLFEWIPKIKNAKRQEILLINTFRFTTNNGRHTVKFPACEIPDRLIGKIDYSHLTTSTYAGKGRAYSIDFERVRDSKGNPLSTKASSWAKLDKLEVTVDTAMSRWKKSILNLGNKRWMKGLEKFVNSPHFLRGMAGLSIICLGIAVRKEEKTIKDKLDITAYSAEIAFLSMKYVNQSKTIEKMMPQLSVKWVGLATGLLFAGSAIWDGVSLFDSDQDAAANLLITSGVSGALSSIFFFVEMATGVAIALALISFASYALAEWIRRNELQLLLENCAYGIEYNFKADSGAQLLELARAKSIYVKRQNLLLRQPWVLSQLTNLEQGLMSASMRLYFTFERISYHESTISFKSVLLDYITFTFHLFNMPLIEGSAEISLLHINEQGKESILNDFLLDEYQDNVTVNAEKGTVTVRFNIRRGIVDRYKKYFTGGQIKAMIRTTHITATGETIHTPTNIHGKEQCAAFYIKYKNTHSVSQTMSKVGASGARKDIPLENGVSFVSYSRKDLPLENDRLYEECASTKAEIEPKWQE